jgi:hypothetical protein
MTTLKAFILHQLREMQREMLLAIDDLSDDDLTSHEPGNHNPIAWIVEHCISNVDFCLHKGITGEFRIPHDPRFTTWPLIEPKPGDPYPAVPELIERWRTVTDASIALVNNLPEERLQEPSREAAGDSEPLVESCLRCINHQNAHLRHIWCILGRRSVRAKWPMQGDWLA